VNICECGCHDCGRYDDADYPHTEYCNAWRQDADNAFADYWQSLTLEERSEIRRKMGQGVK
jgi:hypothetical protein